MAAVWRPIGQSHLLCRELTSNSKNAWGRLARLLVPKIPEPDLRKHHRRLASRKFQVPQARSIGPVPSPKVGADGGAVGEVLLDFRRKSGGAAGITTAAPRNRRSMGQGG